MIFLCYIVLYSHHDPYSSHGDYRTVPVRGFKLMDTANIQYGLRPYTYCKEYSHSCIWYGGHPYSVLSLWKGLNT